MELIGWLLACVFGSGLVCIGFRVRRNERSIREIRETQTEVNLTAEILARAAEQAPTWKRHLRGLVLVPVVAAARQVVRPQVAAAVVGLAFAGGAAFEASRDAGVAERPEHRHHTALAPTRLEPPEPVAATQPAPPAGTPPVRLHATTTTVSPSSPPTTVPPAATTAPVDEPLLSTTTSALPRVLADPEEHECVVDLGGLGIPVGALCGPETP